MESSRTHFEVLNLGLKGQVLGLGLEASSPRKLACPQLEDSTIFWIVKILWSAWKIFWKTFFLWRSLEKFLWRPFFFWRALALVSLVLGLGLESVCPRKGCPWPWPRIFLCPWPRALCPRLHLCPLGPNLNLFPKGKNNRCFCPEWFQTHTRTNQWIKLSFRGC